MRLILPLIIWLLIATPVHAQWWGWSISTGTAFCVRMCDGFYFSLPRGKHLGSGITEQKVCAAMCPGAPTNAFFSRDVTGVENSSNAAGASYAKLSVAFQFKRQLAPSCSCRTQPADGLAALSANYDWALQKGDIVVSVTGPKVFKDSEKFPYDEADFSTATAAVRR